MGKNQAYKAMQRSRLGANAAGPDEVNDGMVDGSFHSPEWHAARLASLNKSHTLTWEEYKKKQKEEEMKKGELEADKDKMMREYRAQLDAERALKLSKGKNHSSSKSSRKDKKDRDSKKRSSSSSKKRKHSKKYSDSSSESSTTESSSSDDESRGSKSRSKRRKKDRKHRSRSKQSSGDEKEEREEAGPLPLSKFFGNTKN